MTTTCSKEWTDHTRSNPCPVCQRHDRCQFTDDGAHRCFRVTEAPFGWRAVHICADQTKIFRRDDGLPTASPRSRAHPNGSGAQFGPNGGQSSPAHPRPRKKKREKKSMSHEWAVEARRLSDAIADEQVAQLAESLGVSIDSLRSLECGWATEADLRRLKVFGQGWDESFPDGAFSVPERSGDGIIIGICFRAVDGPKGAPKGAKRGLSIPTNLDSSPDPVLVVEGPSDVAAAISLGIAAVGRPSNRAGLDHLAALLTNREVIVVGENDERFRSDGTREWPGRDGAESIACGLATKWNRQIPMALPKKCHKDVRAWLAGKKIDFTDMEACHEAGQRLLSELRFGIERFDPAPPELEIQINRDIRRARAEVTALLDGEPVHVDSFDPSSERKRSAFAKALVKIEPRLTAEEIEACFIRKITFTQPTPENEDEAEDATDSPTRAELLEGYDQKVERLLLRMDEDVVREAERMLQDPALLDWVLHDLRQLGVVGEQDLCVTTYLIGASRLLLPPGGPIAGIVQGLSATGKSYVTDQVSLLFPPEALVRCTSFTPQSLYYLPPDGLLHRWVVAGERSRRENDETAEATRALREMISAGRLTKAVTMKIDGRMQTVIIEREGPIAFTESTTLTNLFDEDQNRAILINTDESPEQTGNIVNAIAERAMGVSHDASVLLEVHHALQRLLKRVRVIVPFADRLARAVPHNRPEARRAFSHLLSMIMASALVHQRQRAACELEHGDTIEATYADYKIARALLMAPLAKAIGGALPETAANLAKRLTERYGGETFDTSQAFKDDPIIKSRGKMNQHLRTLEVASVVQLVEEGKGNKPHSWKVIGDVPEASAMWLPEAEALEAER